MWAARAVQPLRHPGLAQRLLSNFTVNTPYLSDSVPLAEGILGVIEEFRVGPGDLVKEGTVVALVDTHKAALEVRSPAAGRVISLLVNVGEEIKESVPIVSVAKLSD
ncbi:hypothetical protein T492DRAFT_1034921 [Pavlovales sp. CCMP2436]|nr:hypothetical protein T492DRAFT_1034921 [Pavlovales sp. CCMP2436]|mmetsp:Transcript_12236/g.30817  ORF Transcript_12236/g.30817 Transcript_12236/m.30817 type:complete len:107 (+) Transcript_12236:136-456(+)